MTMPQWSVFHDTRKTLAVGPALADHDIVGQTSEEADKESCRIRFR